MAYARQTPSFSFRMTISLDFEASRTPPPFCRTFSCLCQCMRKVFQSLCSSPYLYKISPKEGKCHRGVSEAYSSTDPSWSACSSEMYQSHGGIPRPTRTQLHPCSHLLVYPCLVPVHSAKEFPAMFAFAYSIVDGGQESVDPSVH